MQINSLIRSVKQLIFKDPFSSADWQSCSITQKSKEYMEWINSDLLRISKEYIEKNSLKKTGFAGKMNTLFHTDGFEQLVGRRATEYFLEMFRMFDQKCSSETAPIKEITLEDSPINRTAFGEYTSRFGRCPNIRWVRKSNLFIRLLGVLICFMSIVKNSVKPGIALYQKKRKFKVLRESLWGLKTSGGKYFHDDFLVDGNMIKRDDMLFFSRGVSGKCDSRSMARQDALNSQYSSFYLPSLRLSAADFAARILPKYLISNILILLGEITSNNFTFILNTSVFFTGIAIPYEKIFSNYEVISELGHDYFSANHIPESIVCKDHGVKYYLMHWSDNSINIDTYLLSDLVCDNFLMWGKAHLIGVEGENANPYFAGYVFKKFIHDIKNCKNDVIAQMGIKQKGKIITFIDEAFGGEIKMTQDNFVSFWETILKTAQDQRQNTIIIKPKGKYLFVNLTGHYRERYEVLKVQMSGMDNVYIIDETKWSFIEAIGISDIVITQGMTSSATIAIICGIEGLYFDQASYNHPFSKKYKDAVAFDDSEKLIKKISLIVNGQDSVFDVIPEKEIRGFDEFADDRGIDLIRHLLATGRQNR
ncbi:MAG: hypothetical protein WC490_01280 [Candidatus Margulisiibacteriota bacterium]